MFKILITFVLLCSLAKGESDPPTLFGSVIRDLYPNYSDDLNIETMASSWTVTGLLSEEEDASQVRVCGGAPVLGGTGIVGTEGSFARTYEDLPTHTMFYIDIGIKMIGGWKSSRDTLSFEVDGEEIASISIEQVGATDGANSCGGSGNEDLDTRLVGKIAHTADSVSLKLVWALTSEDVEGSFAIHDVSLTFTSDASPDSIVFLNLVDTTVTITPSGNPTGETTCKTGFYWETDDCVACDEACKDCYGSESTQCYQCAVNYNFIDGECQKCDSDCTLCSDVGTGKCLLCNYGFTLEDDGTCTEDADSGDHGCDSVYQYKYQNGSCLDDCWAPYIEKWTDNVGYFCNKPCADKQYLYHDGNCTSTCDTGNKTENGILYCDRCQATTTFKYENDSCLSSCPFPYKTTKVSTAGYCSVPCAAGLYFLWYNGACNKTCENEEFEEVPIDSFDTCREICLLTLQSNGSKKTTCENPDGLCDASEFYFPDLSTESEPACRTVCPAGFFSNKSAICISPCSLDLYAYADGTCLDYCLPGYLPREEDGFKFCDNGFSATIQMIVRYDIALTSWISEKYAADFITLIAKLLEISESYVTITKTTSGSTIVEAEAVITAGSTLTLKSKATAANEKLNAADLKVGGNAVLDKSFTVVMDEIEEPEQKNIELEESSENTVAIAIGVGAGVVVLGAIIVGLKVYRFKVNQREAREIEANREINYRVKDVESTPIRSQSPVTSPNQSRNYQLSERRKLKQSGVY